jgi:hypothetical protein
MQSKRLEKAKGIASSDHARSHKRCQTKSHDNAKKRPLLRPDSAAIADTVSYNKRKGVI